MNSSLLLERVGEARTGGGVAPEAYHGITTTSPSGSMSPLFNLLPSSRDSRGGSMPTRARGPGHPRSQLGAAYGGQVGVWLELVVAAAVAVMRRVSGVAGDHPGAGLS